jgi:hypothetical protein
MKTISEVINEVILSEIDAVQNTHFPSIYSNKDAVALLYMLGERLRDAVHTYQVEEVKPSTGDDVIKVLNDLRETILNDGDRLELEEYVDLDFQDNWGSYNISVEVDSYKVTKLYISQIDDYIDEYAKGFRVEDENLKIDLDGGLSATNEN